jgi:hypothetical protein
LAAGAKYTDSFMDRPLRVGHRAQAERHDDRVERLCGEAQRLCIPELQVKVASQLSSAVPRKAEHRWAQVDTNEPYTVGIGLQIAAGPDADLERLMSFWDPAASSMSTCRGCPTL